MATLTTEPPVPTAPPRTVAPARPRPTNGEQWLHSLGDVPLARVLFDPWPGTATEADLLHRVERDTLCELVNGTLVEKAMAWEEGRIAVRLSTALSVYVEPRLLGIVNGADATLRMATGNVRLPDVSFVSVADLPGGVQPEGAIVSLPPTLAVEVVSRSNTAAEMRQKIREYFASGSRLVWMVYRLTRTIEVFTGPTDEPNHVLTDVDSLDGGAVIPGFTMPVATLFHNAFAPR